MRLPASYVQELPVLCHRGCTYTQTQWSIMSVKSSTKKWNPILCALRKWYGRDRRKLGGGEWIKSSAMGGMKERLLPGELGFELMCRVKGTLAWREDGWHFLPAGQDGRAGGSKCHMQGRAGRVGGLALWSQVWSMDGEDMDYQIYFSVKTLLRIPLW